MTSTMTIRQQVAQFLRRRSPRAICDACVGEHLGLARRQICRAACFLAGTPRYRRKPGSCSGCCSKATVTAFA